MCQCEALWSDVMWCSATCLVCYSFAGCLHKQICSHACTYRHYLYHRRDGEASHRLRPTHVACVIQHDIWKRNPTETEMFVVLMWVYYNLNKHSVDLQVYTGLLYERKSIHCIVGIQRNHVLVNVLTDHLITGGQLDQHMPPDHTGVICRHYMISKIMERDSINFDLVHMLPLCFVSKCTQNGLSLPQPMVL